MIYLKLLDFIPFLTKLLVRCWSSFIILVNEYEFNPKTRIISSYFNSKDIFCNSGVWTLTKRIA